MDTQTIQEKFMQLPDSLKSEALDFIDFLLAKQNKLSAKSSPKTGSMKGTFKMSADFDAPLEDFKDYM
jgi:hypothetical protein